MDCWRSIEIEIEIGMGIGIEIENDNIFDPDFDPEKDIQT